MIPSDLNSSSLSPTKDFKGLSWEVFEEKAGIWGNTDFTNNGFIDHINTTKDTTDYLWYTTRFVLQIISVYFQSLNCSVLYRHATTIMLPLPSEINSKIFVLFIHKCRDHFEK